MFCKRFKNATKNGEAKIRLSQEYTWSYTNEKSIPGNFDLIAEYLSVNKRILRIDVLGPEFFCHGHRNRPEEFSLLKNFPDYYWRRMIHMSLSIADIY